jgi:hypothetical protein
MSHHRVDEIIQKGTFKNLSFKALDSDGPSIADSYLQWTKEQELEMKKSLKEELYTIFMKQSTWVPYVLDGMKVPVGASTGEALIRTPYAATGVYNNELKVIQKKLCPFDSEKWNCTFQSSKEMLTTHFSLRSIFTIWRVRLQQK